MSAIDWSRLPPLSTLRAFEATARLQSYSAAAHALNVTPAAIAQQVRKLETEIDAPLVRREGRGIVLTDAGLELALHHHGIQGNRAARRGLFQALFGFPGDRRILGRRRKGLSR